MQGQSIIGMPEYFIVAFALKHFPTHPINGKKYPVDPPLSYRNLNVKKGDVLLLYCCNDYPKHSKEAPAIGVVIDIENHNHAYVINYQYFPLVCPIPRQVIKSSLNTTALTKFRWLNRNYIFNIANTSFQTIMKGECIDWP